MVRVRTRHTYESASSLITIDPKEPTVACVELFVDDDERQMFQAFAFYMPRAVLENLRMQIDRELRATQTRVEKP